MQRLQPQLLLLCLLRADRGHMIAAKQASTDVSKGAWPPLLQAALQQLVAGGVAATLALLLSASLGWGVMTAAAFAGLLAWVSSLPRWWLPLQLFFWPALAFMHALALPSVIYLLLFAGLLLVYGSVIFSRVPLYLSSQKAWDAVAEWLPAERNFRFLDLGCGMGGILHYLDRRFPFGMFEGVETAPLPFFVSWLRSRLQDAQFRVRYQDMWSTDLSGYDVVYAYLSPQPMPRLWEKVKQEMRPGSVFISNTFCVPEELPHETVELHDMSRSTLYLWRL